MTGTVVKNDASVAKVYFEGTSDTWEVTGKMKQEDLTNLVLQGFVVNGSREADNSTLQEDDTYSGTYFTANKETIFYGHHEGFVTVGAWDFSYNTISRTNSDSTAGAAKYYIYNADQINYFRDTNLTDEITNNDTLRTLSVIDFRLILADDILYLWIDDVLSWRIPLTNSSFGGYEPGSLYQLGLAIADEAGEVKYEELSVKSGDAVDLDEITRFVVKESNMDYVDPILGIAERTDESVDKTLYFAGTGKNNTATQWEVSGTMYRNNLTDNILMGFAVRGENIVNQFFGQHQGFVETAPNWTYYNTVSNNDSYIFNTNIQEFFGNAKSKLEIAFRALIEDDVLYVYFDDVLSWKIPLTDAKFGGFTAGTSYEFGLTFNGGENDTGTAGFKDLTVKSGREILTDEELFVRDAYVLTDNDTYYLYGSRFGGVFDVFTSKDLITWEKQAPCYEHDDNSWFIDTDYWAPEVHKYKNPDTNETAYYMFATFRGNQVTSKRLRGTAILKADSPLGPFKEWSVDSGNSSIYGPVTPSTQQCLDGTLYIEDGIPYIIYCYEYSDLAANNVGKMYYVQLSKDLKQAVGSPIEMFDARTIINNDSGVTSYVIDGPEIYQASDGNLFLLWSTFVLQEGQSAKQYVQLQLRSDNEKLVGATWEYDEMHSILYGDGEPTTENPQETNDFDGGHGMVFKGFDGNEYLILHTPNNWYKSKYKRNCLERSKIFNITYNTETKWFELN